MGMAPNTFWMPYLYVVLDNYSDCWYSCTGLDCYFIRLGSFIDCQGNNDLGRIMGRVTGLTKKGRGRPTLEQLNEFREQQRNSPTLFDTTPFEISKKPVYNLPEERVFECEKDWLQWVYEFLLLNPDVISVLTIYENIQSIGFMPPYSLLQTVKANDPDINNLLEERIISLVLQGKMKSVFAQALLAQKYGWSPDQAAKLEGEIQFDFA